MTQPIIIGVHGLKNKVKESTLTNWWAQAIAEGLRRNLDENLLPAFALAYWADVRNATEIPLTDEDQPYIEAPLDRPLRRGDSNLLTNLRAEAQKWLGRPVDRVKTLFDWGAVERRLGDISLEDLSEYYVHESMRTSIRRKLSVLLERHKEKPILVIAHSMGSIIAYDVIRNAETEFAVNHLITIGSPLGLPLVTANIREEFRDQRTPANVARWTNLADPKDKVALDFNLADEFAANAHGVKVSDQLVSNDYVNEVGETNRHKSYGYLRTPEMSDLIREFLNAV